MPLGVECLGNALVYLGMPLRAHLGIGRLWAGDGSVMDRMFDDEHVTWAGRGRWSAKCGPVMDR